MMLHEKRHPRQTQPPGASPGQNTQNPGTSGTNQSRILHTEQIRPHGRKSAPKVEKTTPPKASTSGGMSVKVWALVFSESGKKKFSKIWSAFKNRKLENPLIYNKVLLVRTFFCKYLEF